MVAKANKNKVKKAAAETARRKAVKAEKKPGAKKREVKKPAKKASPRKSRVHTSKPVASEHHPLTEQPANVVREEDPRTEGAEMQAQSENVEPVAAPFDESDPDDDEDAPFDEGGGEEEEDDNDPDEASPFDDEDDSEDDIEGDDE